MSNFVSYSNAQALMAAIGDKFEKLGCYKFKGSVAFASLPATVVSTMDGWVYNINEDFETDARFVEGAGKKYDAGANVAVADLSTYAAVTPAGTEDPSEEGWYELVDGKYVPTKDTEVASGKTYYAKTDNYKYDVLGEFIDIDAIMDEIDKVADMIIKTSFDESQAYEIGDITKYQRGLYRFTSAHTADDPWDPTEVEVIDIMELIEEAEPEALTQAQIDELIALLG